MFRFTTRFLLSNLKNFEKLEELNAYLLRTKPSHTVVYFRAAWNPQCEITDKHLHQLAAENSSLQAVQIDSDLCPKIVRHYRVRAEPQFIFCLYGDEVLRQIGVNWAGLNDKMNKMVKLGQQTDSSVLAPGQKWMPFGTRFERYYKEELSALYERNVSPL